MKAVKKIAIGAVGMAALLGASAPAAAQYYPGYGYNNPGNVIGQVIQSVINPYGGYGQYGYGMNQQMAVQQCTAAVQQRLSGYSNYGGYGGYGGAYGYTNAYSRGRVLGITRVDQRSSSTLRVRGYATSGMNYGGYGGYGGYGAYGGYNNATADLSFKCDVDYRGYIRDIDINRRY